jgi:hypothetical protein
MGDEHTLKEKHLSAGPWPHGLACPSSVSPHQGKEVILSSKQNGCTRQWREITSGTASRFSQFQM